jgi:hypothetical protein
MRKHKNTNDDSKNFVQTTGPVGMSLCAIFALKSTSAGSRGLAFEKRAAAQNKNAIM